MGNFGAWKNQLHRMGACTPHPLLVHTKPVYKQGTIDIIWSGIACVAANTLVVDIELAGIVTKTPSRELDGSRQNKRITEANVIFKDVPARALRTALLKNINEPALFSRNLWTKAFISLFNKIYP